MTTFEVIDAKPYHVGRIVRRMRMEHRAALLGLGAKAHRELSDVFDASSVRKAWLVDGELSGLGGVVGTLMSNHGYVWLVFSEKALRYPVAMVKETRRQLAIVMTTYSELSTTIIGGDDASFRFAAFLGFGSDLTLDRPPEIPVGSVLRVSYGGVDGIR